LFISFGGHGSHDNKIEKIILSKNNIPKDWVLIIISNNNKFKNLKKIIFINDKVLLGHDILFVDLINASDVILSKPSGAIVAESIIHSKSFLYIKREGFEEQDNLLIQAIDENLSSSEINDLEIESLNQMFIQKLNSVYPNKKLRTKGINGEQQVCDFILNFKF
jgi:hypothetical protein